MYVLKLGAFERKNGITDNSLETACWFIRIVFSSPITKHIERVIVFQLNPFQSYFFFFQEKILSRRFLNRCLKPFFLKGGDGLIVLLLRFL